MVLIGDGAGIIGTDLIGDGDGITGVVMDGMEIIIITMVAEEGIRMPMPIVAIETHQEIQVLIMQTVEEEVILILQILQLEILISVTTPGLLLIQEVQITLQQEQIQGTTQIRIHNLPEVIHNLLPHDLIHHQAVLDHVLHLMVVEVMAEVEDHLAAVEEDKNNKTKISMLFNKLHRYFF